MAPVPVLHPACAGRPQTTGLLHLGFSSLKGAENSSQAPLQAVTRMGSDIGVEAPGKPSSLAPAAWPPRGVWLPVPSHTSPPPHLPTPAMVGPRKVAGLDTFSLLKALACLGRCPRISQRSGRCQEGRVPCLSPAVHRSRALPKASLCPYALNLILKTRTSDLPTCQVSSIFEILSSS